LINAYLLWLLVNGKEIISLTIEIEKALLSEKKDTPLMAFLEKIENTLKGYFR
jgi:hypothetical protein